MKKYEIMPAIATDPGMLRVLWDPRQILHTGCRDPHRKLSLK
jgi:hypothetical protein